METQTAAWRRWLPLCVFALGFVQFLVSFGQRAVVVEGYPLKKSRTASGWTIETGGGPISGWRAAKRHKPTWPVNLVLAHLPIVFTLMTGFGLRRLRWLGALAAGAAFCVQSFIGFFPAANYITELCTGYWLWTGSSLLMCAGFLLAGRSPPIRAEPATAGRVPQEERNETRR